MRVRGKNKNDDDAREQIVDTFGLLDEAMEIAREIKSSAALATTVETWVNRLIVDAKALKEGLLEAEELEAGIGSNVVATSATADLRGKKA